MAYTGPVPTNAAPGTVSFGANSVTYQRASDGQWITTTQGANGALSSAPVSAPPGAGTAAQGLVGNVPGAPAGWQMSTAPGVPLTPASDIFHMGVNTLPAGSVVVTNPPGFPPGIYAQIPGFYNPKDQTTLVFVPQPGKPMPDTSSSINGAATTNAGYPGGAPIPVWAGNSIVTARGATATNYNPGPFGGGGGDTRRGGAPGAWGHGDREDGRGGGGAGSGGTQAQRDAMASLQTTLDQYGLGGLAQWAWGELVNGSSPDQILLDMQNQPAFKARFPALDAMRNAGLPAISPADYLRTEADYKATQRMFGITPSSNPNDYVGLFTGQVSASEFNARLKNYNDLQTTWGPYVKQVFEQYGGMTGITDQQLYGLLSGQDPSLAMQYAQKTGTAFHPMSFADLQRAADFANQQNKGEFMGGGMVQAGLPTNTQRNILVSRDLEGPGLPTPGA